MSIWRLMTGKISRKNSAGEMETHKAPYDFVPTEGELRANKYRMVLVTPENINEVSIVTKNPHSVTIEQIQPKVRGVITESYGRETVTWSETSQRAPMEATPKNQGTAILTTETRTGAEIKADTEKRDRKNSGRAAAETADLVQASEILSRKERNG